MAVTDITLVVGGLDLSARVLTYSVTREITPAKVVTTMDGVEHAALYGRDIINFTLMPMTDSETTQLYNRFASITAAMSYLSVQYTSPYLSGQTASARFRLTSNLESIFGLKASAHGQRYYKGGTITLRRRDSYASSV